MNHPFVVRTAALSIVAAGVVGVILPCLSAGQPPARGLSPTGNGAQSATSVRGPILDPDTLVLQRLLAHDWALALYRHNRGLLCSAPIGAPMVALTFDDGPKADVTPRLLDILRTHRARATFFLVGKQCDRYPALVARIAAEGHEIGNHTYDHLRLPRLSLPQVAAELERNRQALRRITGETTYLFRPPGGRTSPQVQAIVDSLGYTTVFWRIDSGELDRSMNPDRVYHRVVDSIHNGDIVLMHNGDANGLMALPRILDALDRRGYQCVTVSDLVRLSGASPDQAPMPTGPDTE